MRRQRAVVAAAVLVVAVTALATGAVYAYKGSAEREYFSLLDRADTLWQRYKSADRAFFDRGRTDTGEHIQALAAIHDELGQVHDAWLEFEVPDEMVVADLKVGLALELQMAAIAAEVVGLFQEDQSFLDLSADLDTAYENVVDDI